MDCPCHYNNYETTENNKSFTATLGLIVHPHPQVPKKKCFSANLEGNQWQMRWIKLIWPFTLPIRMELLDGSTKWSTKSLAKLEDKKLCALLDHKEYLSGGDNVGEEFWKYTACISIGQPELPKKWKHLASIGKTTAISECLNLCTGAKVHIWEAAM